MDGTALRCEDGNNSSPRLSALARRNYAVMLAVSSVLEAEFGSYSQSNAARAVTFGDVQRLDNSGYVAATDGINAWLRVRF